MSKRRESARHLFASLAKAERTGQPHDHVERHLDRANSARFRTKADRALDRKLAQSVRLKPID